MMFDSGARCFDLMGKARKSYSRALEPVCRKWNLTRNALDVLLFLINNPEYDRAVDIVTRRGIAKSHVSLSVMDLERRGLLTRRSGQGDRRMAHLMLTEAGTAVAREGQAAQERYFKALCRGISQTELEQWRHIMETICANLDQLEQDEEGSN